MAKERNHKLAEPALRGALIDAVGHGVVRWFVAGRLREEVGKPPTGSSQQGILLLAAREPLRSAAFKNGRPAPKLGGQDLQLA